MTQQALFGGSETKTKKEDKYETFANSLVSYTYVESVKKLSDLVGYLVTVDKFAFDTETSSLNPFQTDLVGISISTDAGVAWYIPTNTMNLSQSRIIKALKGPLQDPSIMKIAHNFKFDHQVLYNKGIDVSANLFDTMVAGYLLDSEQKVKMDRMAEKYLNYRPISIDKFFEQGQTMMDIPPEEVSAYACEDADITYRLFEYLDQAMKEEGVYELAYDIEFPVARILSFMEMNGTKLDEDFLTGFGEEIDEMIADVEKKMFNQAGEEFNVNSPQQVGDILFNKMGYRSISKTPSGNDATGVEVLEKLAKKSRRKDDVPELILKFREYSKLNNTYVKALPKSIEPTTGRLHTDFNQTRTVTGRLSSSNPNLQNIPNRKELGRKVRRGFIASEGYTLLSADYSQMELRLIASICQDPNMLEIFRKGEDIHTATAAEIYEVPIEDVTSSQRYDAKTINYGIPYGSGEKKIAAELNKSQSKAKSLLENYFTRFEKVQDYIQGQKEFARKHGYVKTLYGRRRYLDTINHSNKWKRFHAERMAVNAPIQGSSADIMKMAMVDVYNWITEDNIDCRMLLQVHDEILVEIPENDTTGIQKKIVELMENTADIGVALTVDSGTSQNWSEGH